MVNYIDEEWPKEEELLNIGLKMSRQNKADRKKVKRVFCIGNGESRQGFDLEKLRPHGKIYGCNGLYRDFAPDVLCSVDGPMMHEVYQSGYADNNETWLRDWNPVPGMVYDSVKDAFYYPQPYASWTLNSSTCFWEAPVAYPSDGKNYDWDESSTSWKEVTQP